ncbi:hypothetical protein EB118_18850 [bacterium]|nr:hypothetical protein [bacterium]NDD85100.1 hypothetical protein [bacterium]NDG32120.1 hypothetical protein [bacterium]
MEIILVFFLIFVCLLLNSNKESLTNEEATVFTEYFNSHRVDPAFTFNSVRGLIDWYNTFDQTNNNENDPKAFYFYQIKNTLELI